MEAPNEERSQELQLLTILKKRLHERELQAALLGVSADPIVPMEIKQLRLKIEQLEQKVHKEGTETSKNIVYLYERRMKLYENIIKSINQLNKNFNTLSNHAKNYYFSVQIMEIDALNTSTYSYSNQLSKIISTISEEIDDFISFYESIRIYIPSEVDREIEKYITIFASS